MWRRLARSPFAAWILMALLIGTGTLALRGMRAMESAELAAYDWFIRLQSSEQPRDPRILLVSITENDIRGQGSWPLPDGVLASVVEALGQHHPRAVGLDIYRDVPVPPGSERLRMVLERNPSIVGISKYGDKQSTGIASHPVLQATERTGFNDILVDPGGTVRRALLFLDNGSSSEYAFALRLALLYLKAEGITPQPDSLDPRQLRLGQATIRPLEPGEGPYIGADTRGYQFLLDFRGPSAPFAVVTLTQLLSGTVAPSAIRDKLVVVGVSAESVRDDFYTPHSRGRHSEQQISGATIHAHIASQLLRIGLEGVRPMLPLPQTQSIIWIFFWSAAGGMLGLWVRSPWRFALAAAAGLAALGLVAYAAFVDEWWLPVVPAAIAWLAAAGLVPAYVSYRETMQRAALMRLFSSSVSREVAETIWKARDQFLEGGRPRSETLVATALFTDLTGFTTVSEKLGPEMLMSWLNEYMAAMAETVSRNGGVIRQFAGDSIVAIFGVPVPRRSESEIARDAVNAVTCALSMEDTLRNLNGRWSEENRPTTTMRVGIFTGPAVAGTLGSAERSEYVVVGDTINTASRLESFDKNLYAPDPAGRPCRILIGETTRAYLGDLFTTERVGDVILKGKEQAVGVYRVLGWAPSCAPAVSTGGRP
jgi:adenylate cyclase